MMEMANFTELRSNLKYYCDEAEKGNDIFIRRTGTGVVLISMEKYSCMMNKNEEILKRIVEYGRRYEALMGKIENKEDTI